VTTALLLTLYLVVVGLLDNILKPLVMGRGLTTPTLVILIGVIGGTLSHGILGLFIGPIILSVAWELAAAWIRVERTAPVEIDRAMVDAAEMASQAGRELRTGRSQ
jgi:predicted PurR-regulated permease PerM